MSWAEDEGYDAYSRGYEEWINHSCIRKSLWKTKQGGSIQIGSMDDSHLLNAYKKTGDDALFKEMVVRLFEARGNT